MKTIVITGVTSGFGQEWLYELDNQASCHFYILARNANKYNQMCKEKPLKNKAELILCDFLSMESIHTAAQIILTETHQVDVLINNAGLWADPILSLSKDSIESTLAVNHIAPFLLTGLLLPSLKNSDHARIINTASFRHEDAVIDQNDINLKNNFSAEQAYCNSKLYNILFTKVLARKLDNTQITVNCFDPGIVDTPMLKKGMPSWLKFAYPLIKRVVARHPKKGAETGIYLSVAEEAKQQTGLYFNDKKPKKASNLAEQVFMQNWLWEQSVQLTNIDY